MYEKETAQYLLNKCCRICSDPDCLILPILLWSRERKAEKRERERKTASVKQTDGEDTPPNFYWPQFRTGVHHCSTRTNKKQKRKKAERSSPSCFPPAFIPQHQHKWNSLALKTQLKHIWISVGAGGLTSHNHHNHQSPTSYLWGQH